jgi:hypothetical protein
VVPDPSVGWCVVVNGDVGRARRPSHFDSVEVAGVVGPLPFLEEPPPMANVE